MRLFEFEDAFANTLITVLRNAKGRSDEEDAPLFLPWVAVSRLMEPYGYGEITYKQFAGLYDQNPDFQSVVQNFDEKGLEIDTQAEMPEPEAGQGELPVPVPTGPSVDQMASQAANYKPQLSPR
jgi:hypothetical protein